VVGIVGIVAPAPAPAAVAVAWAGLTVVLVRRHRLSVVVSWSLAYRTGRNGWAYLLLLAYRTGRNGWAYLLERASPAQPWTIADHGNP